MRTSALSSCLGTIQSGFLARSLPAWSALSLVFHPSLRNQLWSPVSDHQQLFGNCLEFSILPLWTGQFLTNILCKTLTVSLKKSKKSSLCETVTGWCFFYIFFLNPAYVKYLTVWFFLCHMRLFESSVWNNATDANKPGTSVTVYGTVTPWLREHASQTNALFALIGSGIGIG